MNCALLEKARCLRLTSGLAKEFWAEALSTAVHIVNRISCSAINNKIPEEVWKGKSIDLNYLRVFGSSVYVHDPGDKLEPRAFKGVLLGYMDGVKGYRVWNPKTKKARVSRHVTFDELAMFKENDDSSDVLDLAHGESKEKEVIPAFRPRSRGSRFVQDACEEVAVDGTSHCP